MISLADLQRPALSLHWHEAVAVIAELADTMRASGLTQVPAPESIVITADGALVAAGGLALEGLPTRNLAGLLEGLLSSCPPEVKEFVTGNLAEPPAQATLEAFADTIAFFERPGRRGIVQAVAARAAEVENEARADDELEKLAARARAKQVEEPGVPPQDAPTRPRKRGVLVAGAAAILLLAGAGFVLFVPPSKPATLTGRVQTRVKEIVQAGLEAVGVERPRESPPAPAPLADPASSAPRAKRRPSARQTRPVELTVRVNELGGVPAPSAAAPDERVVPEPPANHDSTVYDADSDGVEPAVLVRPHLPARPASSIESAQLGVLELVVSHTGAVDHVRLISPENRYHDRMMVAAAKTWRFRPATKDGLPVRSRTHIRVTQ